MATKKKDTFSERASLFASPADSSSIPKKRISRAAPLPRLPVFDEDLQQNVEETRATQSTFFTLPTVGQQSDPDDDVEPMEVDTSMVPSPVKSSKVAERVPLAELFAPESPPKEMPENVPCTKATTPRRKSMPTPGKKLCFSSREIENEARKADDTSHLELLMASNPEEVPKTIKALLTDKKEMGVYLNSLQKEMASMEVIRKFRESMLTKARELSNESTLLSTIPRPLPLMDLTIRREETPEETVKRLYANFLENTQSAGQQMIAEKKAEAAERETRTLQSKYHRLKEIEEKYENMEKTLQEGYAKHREALQRTSEKMQKMDELVERLQPISLF